MVVYVWHSQRNVNDLDSISSASLSKRQQSSESNIFDEPWIGIKMRIKAKPAKEDGPIK